jgi:beta-glucosidase
MKQTYMDRRQFVGSVGQTALGIGLGLTLGTSFSAPARANTGITFPDGFIWGTATAAHQVEGNNTNNDVWLMENVADSMFAEPSGDAIDHYNRYREDIALLAELGFNTYRFSVEWARVEPTKGVFSDEELEHYHQVLLTCHEFGLKPYVTFHHFTSPRWLMTQGGWEDEETPALFARYCAKVTEAMGDLIAGACTINEANIGRVLISSGTMPSLDVLRRSPTWVNSAAELGISPDTFNPFIFAVSDKGKDIVMAAHHQAAQAIKATGATFPVGITLAVQDIQAVTGGEAVAAAQQEYVNDVYLRDLAGDDFIGVQCYSRHRFDANGPIGPEEGVELTQMGYEFWPEALEVSIRRAYKVSGLPVLITENGIGTKDDSRRIEYVRRALTGVSNCLKDGIPILGYTYWSALDNFEWMFGYRPTFGLIGVDRTTQKRTPKPSAHWLGSIAKANHFDPND